MLPVVLSVFWTGSCRILGKRDISHSVGPRPAWRGKTIGFRFFEVSVPSFVQDELITDNR